MKKRLFSFSDEEDARLVRLAKESYGGEKGALSKTMREALERMEKEKQRERAAFNILALIEKKRKLGIERFDRNQAYQGHRFG